MSPLKPIQITLISPLFLTALLCYSASNAADVDEVTAPDGEFVVTAIRRASMVESTQDTEPNIGDTLGASANFSEKLVWIDGTSCVSWSAKKMDNAHVDLHDPMLSDLAIEKLQPPAYEVFTFSESMAIYCGDDDLEPVANITRVDDRILLVASISGSFNVILEKPLTSDQVKKLQTQLTDMKYYDGDINGEIDAATRAAVSAYAEYRGAQYRFKDAVITENLLDGLDVL